MSQKKDRSEHVRNNLAYALTKLQQLSSEIHDAQMKDLDIQYLGQKVGEILGACRECFDYCAKDIVDTFVNAEDADKKKRRVSAYFPFYEDQLTKSGSVFTLLSKANPEIYEHLLGLSRRIEGGDIIPGTNIRYKIAADLNHIVNDKKHNIVTETYGRERSKTAIQFPGGVSITMSPVMPYEGDFPVDLDQECDATLMSGSEGVDIKYVKEYKLHFNKWDVSTFCNTAINCTFYIVSKIYEEFFGIPSDFLNPRETIKPEAVKRLESALRRAFPATFHLAKIVLYEGEKMVYEATPLHFHDPKEMTMDAAIFLLFDFIFRARVKRDADRLLRERIARNSEEVSRDGVNGNFTWLEQSTNGLKVLVINEEYEIAFTRVVWGVGIDWLACELRVADRMHSEINPNVVGSWLTGAESRLLVSMNDGVIKIQ